jgi:hypothetical protein
MFVCKRDGDKYGQPHPFPTKPLYICTNSFEQPVPELPSQEE